MVFKGKWGSAVNEACKENGKKEIQKNYELKLAEQLREVKERKGTKEKTEKNNWSTKLEGRGWENEWRKERRGFRKMMVVIWMD